MSELNPEVGDLWIHKIHKSLLYINEIGENFISFIGVSFEKYPNGKVYESYYGNSFSERDERYKYFAEIYEYLGKSKCRVEDLFCVKENAENVTQTDLHNIDDIQFPPRHDKTAYELQIENNKLKEKIEFAKQAVDLFFKTENESKLLEIAEWE